MPKGVKVAQRVGRLTNPEEERHITALTRSRVAMGAEVGTSAVLVAICVLVAALGSAATGYLFHSRMTGLPLRQLLSSYTVERTRPPLCRGMTDIDDQPRDVDRGIMSSVPGHRGIPAQRPVSQGQSRRRWGYTKLVRTNLSSYK